MAASKVNISSSDQPRVNAKSLNKLSAPANLQYRTSGVKTYNARQPTRMAGRNFSRY